MNKALLKEMIDKKLVSVQKHPNFDLFIYNYTPQVQYDKLWNEITLSTRGLILDAEMNVVAKPFGKFFNLEEHDPSEIPALPFDVFEKLDGSLGILYWIEGVAYIATRGSFTSTQAIHATQVLYSKYFHILSSLNRDKTYLFEIIFPDNRIVVNYGDVDDLFLLTIIDNQTGEETIEDIGFPVVKRFDGITDFNTLKSLEEENKEGFVIRFSNGFRVKVKFADYVRLHRIITGISSLAIWEYLSEGKSFDELLEKVPDEFYEWVKHTSGDLKGKYNSILQECQSVFKVLDSRKETALYFQQQKYPHVLFNMLDGKEIEKGIWKIVRPTYSKAFKVDAQ